MNKKKVILIIDNNVDIDTIIAIGAYLKKYDIQTTKVALTLDPVVNKQNFNVAADAYMEDIDMEKYLAICVPDFFDISAAGKNSDLLNLLYKAYLMNKLIVTIGNGFSLIKTALEDKNIDIEHLSLDKVLHFDSETDVPNNSGFFKKLLRFLTVERVQIK